MLCWLSRRLSTARVASQAAPAPKVETRGVTLKAMRMHHSPKTGGVSFGIDRQGSVAYLSVMFVDKYGDGTERRLVDRKVQDFFPLHPVLKQHAQISYSNLQCMKIMSFHPLDDEGPAKCAIPGENGPELTIFGFRPGRNFIRAAVRRS